MLRGKRVGLRARHESDIPILMDELYNDINTRAQADTRPWRPVPPDAKDGPYDVNDLPDTVVCFSVVGIDTKKLVGEALLWGIDMHNRLAHIGISLRPLFRGQGLSEDVVRLLCHYGFVIRGLNRLQIDTLADNEAMKRSARAVGFTHEATFRKAAWVTGEFVDEVAFGLLASDWRAAGATGSA